MGITTTRSVTVFVPSDIAGHASPIGMTLSPDTVTISLVGGCKLKRSLPARLGSMTLTTAAVSTTALTFSPFTHTICLTTSLPTPTRKTGVAPLFFSLVSATRGPVAGSLATGCLELGV